MGEATISGSLWWKPVCHLWQTVCFQFGGRSEHFCGPKAQMSVDSSGATFYSLGVLQVHATKGSPCVLDTCTPRSVDFLTSEQGGWYSRVDRGAINDTIDLRVGEFLTKNYVWLLFPVFLRTFYWKVFLTPRSLREGGATDTVFLCCLTWSWL